MIANSIPTTTKKGIVSSRQRKVANGLYLLRALRGNEQGGPDSCKQESNRVGERGTHMQETDNFGTHPGLKGEMAYFERCTNFPRRAGSA